MMLQFFHWYLQLTPTTVNQSWFRNKNHSKSRPPTGFSFINGRDITQKEQSDAGNLVTY